MKLTEYQSKVVLAYFEIASPWGKLIRSYEDLVPIAEDIESGYVLKPQSTAPKAKRAERVRFCTTEMQLKSAAVELLRGDIDGEPIREVLAERRIDLVTEHYLAFVRREGKPFFLASFLGGGDIDTFLRDRPDKAAAQSADPGTFGFAQIRKSLAAIGFEGQALLRVAGIAEKLFACFTELAATLAEINPLGRDSAGEYFPLDARIVVAGEGEEKLKALLLKIGGKEQA